ncbi:MAG: HepT-like ribonuclease domain-containing protein [Calditrichota bacterium]
MKSEEVYLRSVLDSISQIESYITVGHEVFIRTAHWQDAVVRRLINIGETVKNLSPLSRSKHPEISWRKIAGLRDVLTHDYMDVDYEALWIVAIRDLPELKQAVEDILTWF